jgi:hypothetical protein
METVSQQGLARFAPPDNSADARVSLCAEYAQSDASSRDHAAVLQPCARRLRRRYMLALW